MPRLVPALIALVAIVTAAPGRQISAQSTPGNGFLRHWFELRSDERRKLAAGQVVVRALPVRGRHIGVIAVGTTSISPDVFVSRLGAAATITRGGALFGRFSSPPAVADLAGVSLEQGDIDRLRICRRGDCRLNLANAEIDAIRAALGGSTQGPSAEAQDAFRRIVLERARTYLSGGLAALADYDDRPQPVRPATVFAELVGQSPYLTAQLPAIAAALERVPPGRPQHADTFLQWARIPMNDKIVVMVTDVSIFRPTAGPDLPAVLVAGKQVYASRYMNGALTLTMLFEGRDGPNYLVHVDRSDLDELGGTFSGLKRSLMESRIRDEAAGALATLRDRLEHP